MRLSLHFGLCAFVLCASTACHPPVHEVEARLHKDGQRIRVKHDRKSASFSFGGAKVVTTDLQPLTATLLAPSDIDPESVGMDWSWSFSMVMSTEGSPDLHAKCEVQGERRRRLSSRDPRDSDQSLNLNCGLDFGEGASRVGAYLRLWQRVDAKGVTLGGGLEGAMPAVILQGDKYRSPHAGYLIWGAGGEPLAQIRIDPKGDWVWIHDGTRPELRAWSFAAAALLVHSSRGLQSTLTRPTQN